MIEKKCEYCGKDMKVRLADHKRGWGRFCSKSCKAKKQTLETGVNGPDYRISGISVDKFKSGKRNKSKFKGRRKTLPMEITHDEWGDPKRCYCGEIATHFVNSGFGHNGWEGTCEDHVDDTYPHDSSNFDY